MSYPRNAASPPIVAVGAIYLLADGTIQTTGASVRVKTGTGAWGSGAGTLACDSTSGIWTYAPTQAETDAESFIVGVYKSASTSAQVTVATSASATAGYGGVDWGKVTQATSTVSLSNTTISTTQAVASVSGSVGSVTGAVGSVTGAVGSVTARVTANTDQWAGVTVTGMPMPTYTQPTGFLAATFPATVSSFAGGAVASVSGSVGSIAGVTFPTNFGVLGINASGHVSRVTLVDTTTTNTDMRGTDNAALASAWTATRAGYLDGVLLADNYNIRVVSVTGSKHIASVVHSVEPAAIPEDAFVDGALSNRVLAASAAAEVATAVRTELTIELGRIDVTSSSRLASSAYTAPDNASIALIKTVTDRLNTTLTADGLLWQFTTNALENAPGGGGGGSATLENQQAILTHLTQIKGAGWVSGDNLAAIADLVAAGIGSALASLGFTTGTITGFPSTLRVRDSYTLEVNRAISVYVRDSQGTPITQVGTKTFADADFKPTCVITQDGQSGRVEAVVTWVPPAAGAEGYLRIEIPSNKSAYARAGVASVQVVLQWTGVTFTLATQSVTWLPAV